MNRELLLTCIEMWMEDNNEENDIHNELYHLRRRIEEGEEINLYELGYSLIKGGWNSGYDARREEEIRYINRNK